MLEYRPELCLIHLVQTDVRGAIPSVLPGEIDDWTRIEYIAVDLRCAVVLCCRFLVRANVVDKVRDGVERKDALQ